MLMRARLEGVRPYSALNVRISGRHLWAVTTSSFCSKLQVCAADSGHA
jgi:hypothetical protein